MVKLTELYDVSADYILLGIENITTASVTEKKKINIEYRKAIGCIAIIAATAIITVLFIAALGLLQKFGL